MATQSIKKNIVIHDKNSATAFVEALEKAAAIATKAVKGKKNIRAFFGDKL